MASPGEILVKIRADMQDLETGLKKATESIDKESKKWENTLAAVDRTGRGLSTVGAGLTAGVTVPLVAAGLASTKMAGDYEAATNKLQADTDATAQEMEAFKAIASEIGPAYGLSAIDVIGVMDELGLKGMSTSEIMATLPANLALAAAAQINVADAGNIAFAAMKQFNLTAEDQAHISDVLVTGANQSSASVTDLADAYSYAGSLATLAGWSFEETTAAIGLMTDAGLTGQKAGTGLRSALSQLLTPTDQQTKLMSELGISIYDASGKLKPAETLMTEFKDAGLDTNAALTLFGVEGAPAMLALIKEGDKLPTMTKNLEDSEGAAKKMSDVRMEGLNGSMREMTAEMQNVAVEIGTELLPIIKDVWEAVKPLIPEVKELLRIFKEQSPEIKTLVIGFVALVAAAGPVLVIVGQLMIAAASLAPVITGLSTALGGGTAAGAGGAGLVGALGALLGPIALIIAAIIALVAIFAFLWTYSEDFRNGIIGIWNSISEAGGKIWNELVLTASFMFGNLMAVVKVAVDFILWLWQGLGPILEPLIKGNWDALVLIIQTAIDLIGSIISVALALLRGDWSTAWNHIKDAGQTIWDLITGGLGIAVDMWTGMLGGIIKLANSAIELINKATGSKIPTMKFGEDKTEEIDAGIRAGTYHLTGRASGGPVSAGTPYIVGEQGQELFVPSTNGTIIPNGALSGGEVVIHNYIYLDGDKVGESVVRRIVNDRGYGL